MLGKIIGFELRYRFKMPLTYIFIAMMVFQAIWYAKGSYDYYVTDTINLNAAGIIYRSLAGGGMLMIIAVAIITGSALYKDIEYKTATTFYSYPVSDKTWLAGKYIAAYIVNLVICLAYALGFSIIQYSGIGHPEQFGPVPWGQIFYGYLVFSVPNMFVMTTIAISMVVFFKNMASSYLGVFIVTMLFIIAEGTRENSACITAVHLMEPFAYTWAVDLIEKLPVAAKNFGYLPLEPMYWLNRAVWLGISGVLLFFSFRKFSFKYFVTHHTKRAQLFNDEKKFTATSKLMLIPQKVFSFSENMKKLFRLSHLEFKNTTRPVGFKIIFGLLAIMFFGYNYMWNADYYIGTNILPITSVMTFTRLPNGIFMYILLAVFAGELLFKERTVQIWQITDTLPVPVWVTWFSKYIAMAGIALMFAFLLFVPGIFAQAIQGFYDFEFPVYFNDLFLYHFGWMNYLFIIALAFFVGALTANRFGAHIMSVGIIFFLVVFEDIGVIEQLRLVFSYVPGSSNYSEMNGYGIFGDASFYYAIMWTILSAFFLIAGVWFWNRGSARSVKNRFSIKNPQLSAVWKIATVVLLVAFFYMQHYIVENENVKGNFKTEDQQDAEDAEYEKLFKYIDGKNQPFVCGLDLTIDISPDIRKADYNFDMLLTNRGNTAIDTLYLSLKDFVTINSLQLGNEKLVPAWNNEKHYQLAYALSSPVQIGDTVHLKGACTLQYTGFSSRDAQEALVYNGSFMSEDIVPHIGYNDDKELEENRTRAEYGLEKLQSRMDPVDDKTALCKDAVSPRALWQNTTIKVHTGDGQTPYASGIYSGTENINGKQYAVYKTENSAAMKWYIGSARYAELDTLLNNGTKLRLLYDAPHTYNLKFFVESTNDAMAFLEKQLGAYPYSQLIISEIPRYNNENFYSAPNLISISERHSWTANGKTAKDLSYIYNTNCMEIFAQWVKQNLHVADVQGADMLLKAIPEAYALAFIEEKFGKETLQIYLDKKHERYSKGRGNEANTEAPLLYADGADYLEKNKGAMELLNVMHEIGIDKFSEIFINWTNDNKGKNLVFKDFYQRLSNVYPVEKKKQLTDAFEKVLE